jgi:hypothetical protein
MIALYARDVQGYGQHVDVSAMETMAVAQIHSSIHHQFGRTPGRRESPLVEAQDGWVSPGLERGVRQDTWPRVCDMIGRPDLKDNPTFSTPEARREHQQDLLAILSGWTATQPKEEIYHLLQEPARRRVCGHSRGPLHLAAIGGTTVFPGDRPSLCRQSSLSWRLFASRGTPGGTAAPPCWVHNGRSTAVAWGLARGPCTPSWAGMI